MGEIPLKSPELDEQDTFDARAYIQQMHLRQVAIQRDPTLDAEAKFDALIDLADLAEDKFSQEGVTDSSVIVNGQAKTIHTLEDGTKSFLSINPAFAHFVGFDILETEVEGKSHPEIVQVVETYADFNRPAFAYDKEEKETAILPLGADSIAFTNPPLSSLPNERELVKIAPLIFESLDEIDLRKLSRQFQNIIRLSPENREANISWFIERLNYCLLPNQDVQVRAEEYLSYDDATSETVILEPRKAIRGKLLGFCVMDEYSKRHTGEGRHIAHADLNRKLVAAALEVGKGKKCHVIRIPLRYCTELTIK